MKVFEIDNASGAWQLAPGVAQTLSAGITVTLDTGFSEALIEIDAASNPDQQVTVGGRPLVDVGPWAVGEALTVGAQRFVLLAARQAYVPDAGYRASSKTRLTQLGVVVPTAVPATSPFVQLIPAVQSIKRSRWPRRAIGAFAALSVMIAVAEKVTNASDDRIANQKLTASAPAPQTMPAEPDEVAPNVAPVAVELAAPAPTMPATSPVEPRKPVTRQVKRPVASIRSALSQSDRQQLAAQIDSAALIGGFDPARAKQELQKIQPRVAHDSDLRRRLERELGRL